MSDNELTPEQRFAAPSPEETVPRALLAGRAPAAIVRDLVRLGYTPAAAEKTVARVQLDLCRFNESADSRRRLIDEAWWQFVRGGLMAVCSIPVIALTVLFGIATAAVFGVVLIGLIIVAAGWLGTGLVLMGRGWSRWCLYCDWAAKMGPTTKLPPLAEPRGEGITPRPAPPGA